MIGPKHYTLNDRGEPVHEPDLLKWCRWFEGVERKVAETVVGEGSVSTVFLGFDHGHWPSSARAPILWETMVFGGPLNEAQRRCSGSREQALAMHAEMVEAVQVVLAFLERNHGSRFL